MSCFTVHLKSTTLGLGPPPPPPPPPPKMIGGDPVVTVMVTVVSAVVPALTPLGSGVPKASFTLSPSSSSASGNAVKVSDFDLSPSSKVTLAGTEKSAADASRPGPVATRGE